MDRIVRRPTLYNRMASSSGSRIAPLRPPVPREPPILAPGNTTPDRGNRANIEVTRQPVRVSATGAQELRLALDVLAFDILDLELRVLRLEGTGPSVTVELQTAMQTESDEGWVTAETFSAASSAPSSELIHVEQFLRYVRFNVTALSGSGSPAATFMIHGVGRWWA